MATVAHMMLGHHIQASIGVEVEVVTGGGGS